MLKQAGSSPSSIEYLVSRDKPLVSINTIGRYKIIREIARSNDVVYEAVDTGINRRVALKELLLPPNLAGIQRRERVERFYREARAAGSLAHPNIVTVFEAGEDNGRHFIAMEYLEGQTLRDVLDIEGQVAVERAVTITKQVLDGLAYAHANSVVHRDIKPDNIQILPGGNVKITDFGIARLMDEPSLTADGQVFGTPSYMSPEQVSGRPLDNRSDLFSLGVVLYEMLTGRKPFTGDTVVTITYNIMNQDVIIPPSVPPYLERVVRRSLCKDPNGRYRTAAEMALELDPNSFVPGMPQPDPYAAMQTQPPPFYGPGSAQQPAQQPQYQPAISQPPPDPFVNLRPGDLSLPRVPSKPLISPEAWYFMKVMAIVLLVLGVFIFFVWAFNASYQKFQQQGNEGLVQGYIDAGEEYFRQESYLAAADQFKTALNLTEDPQLQMALRHNVGTCYTLLGDNGLQQTGNVEAAMSWYEKALEVDPKNSDAQDRVAYVYLWRGNQAQQQGDLNGALSWWKTAMDTAPGTPSGQAAAQKIQQYTNTHRSPIPDGGY